MDSKAPEARWLSLSDHARQNKLDLIVVDLHFHGIIYGDTMDPLLVLNHFDNLLAAAGLSFRAVVIGGTALRLLRVISRSTRDVDVLDPSITANIHAVATQTAHELRAAGIHIEDEWLNNGPITLQEILPSGWKERLSPLFSGKAVHLSTLGRDDLLKTKFFAYCDRGFDHADCFAMAPSRYELESSLGWLQKQDAHPDWPEHVAATLKAPGQELQHEL